MKISLSMVFKAFGIVQTPEVEKVIDNVMLDFSGSATLDPKTIRSQIESAFDALGVLCTNFSPDLPGLLTVYTGSCTIFNYPPKTHSVLSDAIKSLVPDLKAKIAAGGVTDILAEVNAAVAAWLETHTGVPAAQWGWALSFVDQLAVTIIMGLL